MQIPQSNPASLSAQAPVTSTRGTAPQSAVAPVRGASSVGVDPAVTGLEAPATAEALVARLDAFGAGLAQNIGEALAALPAGARESAQGTLGHFEHNLGRIRAGIEDGSLRGEDLGRAMQGALGSVRFDLARVSQAGQGQAGLDEAAPSAEAEAAASAARVAASEGSDVAATGASAQGRFQNIINSVNQRLTGLGNEAQGEAAAELQAAQKSFASAAARIETAFFEGGDFDRGTFYGLLSASVGRLQQRVSDLQSGTQAQDATLYDPKRGVESLSEGLRKVRFDRTV